MRSYRLNDRSARRRRVTSHLLLGAQAASGVALPPVQESPPALDRQTNSRPVLESSGTGAGVRNSSARSGKSRRPQAQSRPSIAPPGSRSSTIALTQVGQRLANDQPLKWILGGDSLIRPGGQVMRTVGRSIAEMIHGQLGRCHDLIVDQMGFGQRIKPSVVDRLAEAIAIEEADLLVLMCGNRDAFGGIAGVQRFEESLHRLLFQASVAEVPVILNTPPCLRSAESEADVDRMVYHEVLISTALEYDALIVDHWSYWEWGSTANGSLNSWLSSDPSERAVRGIQEICSLLNRELTLSRQMMTVQV